MSKNIKVDLIPLNEINPYSLENCGLSQKDLKNMNILIKNTKLNEFELWKQFVNHEFVQIKNKYINNDKLNEYKWRLIIKYIIKSTHDFDFAKLVKNNHEKLFDFFQRYYDLKTIDTKNIKVSKEEKKKFMNTDEFKEFESCFPNKLELIKIICHIHQATDYVYFKHIVNDKLQKMMKMEQDMNLLEISHQEYEIYYQNSQYVNIRLPKNNEIINNDEEFEKYIIKNIDTKMLLFTIVNNIVDIRNLWLNRDNEIIINTTYYSFSISNISQNSDKTFDQIMLYKQLLNELIHRKDINECIDEYIKLNLNGSQLAELENLRKIVNI
jgi:hypothetical protein